MPGPLTYTDLVHDMHLTAREVFRGHWYDLPARPAPSPATSRAQRIISIAIVISVAAAIAVVVVFSARIGSLAGWIVSILTLILIGALPRLGITSSDLERSVAMAGSMTGRPK
jgi:uncharacterized membrane protein